MAWRAQLTRVGFPSSAEVLLGVIMILVILEAARRTAGLVLAATAIVFLVYALAGPYSPGFLAHRGYSLPRLVSFLFMTSEGIYGIPLGVSSTYVVLFVLFGAFLNRMGGGKLFIDAAYAVTGRFRGGPAKTAVLSSGLMGTISGSAIANVVTTGTFTIPLMKQMGYHPDVAGAVEAVASTGGMIMPPVMGAAAFIIAQYLGIPYAQVAWAALIPAVLYYLCVFFIVDMEAAKHGLRGLPAAQLPSLSRSLAQGGLLFVPILVLIALILRGVSPTKAVFWSTILVFAVAFVHRPTRPNLTTILGALEDGAKNSISVAISCACAGLIVGVISLTGIGVKFSSSLIELSHGSIFLALVYTMIASIILGMGMPATAVYVIQAALNVPALVQMGVAPLAAHLFVFYFSVVACITPPVALTAYAAAGISGGHPGKTGWNAFWFGCVAYIVPYIFVYSPCLLMQGTAWAIVSAFATAAVGTYLLAAGIEGFFIIRRSLIERVLLFLAGVALIIPGGATDVLSLPLVAVVVVLGLKRTGARKVALEGDFAAHERR